MPYSSPCEGKQCAALPIFYGTFSDLLIKYISNVIRHRDGPDDINDINDTRNGLLLNSLLHIPFGAISMAFLKVYCYFHPELLLVF